MRVIHPLEIQLIMNRLIDVDEMSHVVCSRLRDRFNQVSGMYGESGNIVGLFFHGSVVDLKDITIRFDQKLI